MRAAGGKPAHSPQSIRSQRSHMIAALPHHAVGNSSQWHNFDTPSRQQLSSTCRPADPLAHLTGRVFSIRSDASQNHHDTRISLTTCSFRSTRVEKHEHLPVHGPLLGDESKRRAHHFLNTLQSRRQRRRQPPGRHGPYQLPPMPPPEGRHQSSSSRERSLTKQIVGTRPLQLMPSIHAYPTYR